MIIHKNIKSGKAFIYIKDIDWEKFQVITPLNQIKVVERHLFSDDIEGSNQEFLDKGIISVEQLKVYNDYQRNRQEDLREFNTVRTTQGKGFLKSRGHRRQVMHPTYGPRRRVMKSIEIDEEVYALLQQKAIPFEEPTPNHVIRRLLGIESKPFARPRPVRKTIRKKTIGSKAPRADLSILVENGILHEGQRLFFKYSGHSLSNRYEAKISGDRLIYDGSLHTMSGLVADILDHEGHGIPSRAYRGPDYWCNENGTSIRQLWEQFLKSSRY